MIGYHSYAHNDSEDTHDLRPVSDRMPVTPATASGRAVTCIKQASKKLSRKGNHERRVGVRMML